MGVVKRNRKNRGDRSVRRASPDTEILHGRHVVEEALRADRRKFGRLCVRQGGLAPEWTPVLEMGRKRGVLIQEMDPGDWEGIQQAAGESQLQGCVLEAGPLPVIEGVAALRSVLSDTPGGSILIALDGVEDPQNVGSLARVADAAGVAGIVLTDRRSPPLSPALSRASAGAIEWQRVARVTNLSRALRELKGAGFWVVAADPTAERTVFEFPDRLLSGDLVVVLGAEGKGLRPGILAEVDHGARLPMLGQVQSLNVATAGAILLYEIVRRRKVN